MQDDFDVALAEHRARYGLDPFHLEPWEDCPTCDGYGEITHPLYGAYNCPEPYITCPDCGGRD